MSTTPFNPRSPRAGGISRRTILITAVGLGLVGVAGVLSAPGTPGQTISGLVNAQLGTPVVLPTPTIPPTIPPTSTPLPTATATAAPGPPAAAATRPPNAPTAKPVIIPTRPASAPTPRPRGKP